MSEPMSDEHPIMLCTRCARRITPGECCHGFTAEQMRAQYSAGFRDGRASAMALDPQAPVIAGSS